MQLALAVGAGDLREERQELLVSVPGFDRAGDLAGRDEPFGTVGDSYDTQSMLMAVGVAAAV